MKVLIVALILLGAVLGMAAMVLVIGLFVPRVHEDRKVKELPVKPEEAWAKLTDFPHFPDWQPWMANVEKLSGEEGLGTVWRHKEKSGDHLDLEVTTWEPNRKLVTTIADKNLPFSGSWTTEIEPTETGCRVTITERGEIPNPLMRTMWILFQPSKSSVERFLEAL